MTKSDGDDVIYIYFSFHTVMISTSPQKLINQKIQSSNPKNTVAVNIDNMIEGEQDFEDLEEYLYTTIEKNDMFRI